MNNFLWLQLGKERGGGGSGGSAGTLPPGVYWRPTGIYPSEYRNAHFVLQGELYALAGVFDPNECEIYKYANGSYTKVATLTANNTFYPEYCTFAELNGKIHIFNSFNNFHYTWDGVSSTAVGVTAPPETIKSVVAFNGVLYASSSMYLYKSDETGNALTKISTTGDVKKQFGPLFVYNGTLYGVNITTGNLYSLDTATLKTQSIKNISTAYRDITNYAKLVGKTLYFARNSALTSGGDAVYKYDMESGVLAEIGYFPMVSDKGISYVYNGEYRISCLKDQLVMHEIEAPAEE